MTTLSHLETFLEVANRGSFASAARGLGLPKSTVTARVRALEDELGVALFRRTTRQVQLTPEGETYFSRVGPATRQLEEAAELLKSAQTPEGEVRLSVPVDLPLDMLAGALSAFRVSYPKVSIDVHISDRPVDLTAERFDFALRGNRVTSENVVVRKIAASPMTVVGRPDLFANSSFARLVSDGKVLDPAGSLASDLPKTAALAFKTRNLQLARELVLVSDVAAVLPRPFCKELLASGRLAELDARPALPDLPLYVVLPERRLLPTRVRLLVDHLARSLA